MSDDMTDHVQSPAGTSRRNLLGGMGAAAAGAGIVALAGAQPAQAAIATGTYNSYGPLRVVDTRYGYGGLIRAGEVRTFTSLSGSEFTMAVNLTVVGTAGSGYLSIYSADLASRPAPYSSINWQGAGRVVANFAIFDLGDAGFRVYCGGGAGVSTHFIIDRIGFFRGSSTAARAAQSGPSER